MNPPARRFVKDIDERWLEDATMELEMAVEEVCRRYEALAEKFRLRLAWRSGRD